jgi:LysM repeat protein
MTSPQITTRAARFARALTTLLVVLSLMGMAAPDAMAKRVKVKVIPGDTLWDIARRYDVKVSKIKKWNPRDTGGGKALRPGMKLVIYTDIPVRERRLGTYRVKRGDNLGKIAKKLDVSVKHLTHVNKVDPRKLRPGQRLRYYKEGARKDSIAIGAHNRGRLIDGELLRPGPGYYLKQKDEVWGTNETVTTLVNCVADYHKKHPNSPDILIGDISLKRGGSFRPHLSHQTGLDVDLGYVQPGVKEASKRFVPASGKSIDIKRNWTFYRCLLRSNTVTMAFMNTYLQKMFRKALKKGTIKIKGYTTDQLFQVHSKTPHRAIFRHAKGHHDHIHVRFGCDKGDPKCRNTGGDTRSVKR